MIAVSAAAPDFNAYLDETESVGAETIRAGADTSEYADFPLEEFSQRYARLITLMQREGITGIIATQEENVRYFTGYLTVLWISKFRPNVAILPSDTSLPAGLVLPTQERGNAEITSWIGSPTIYPAQEPPVPHIVGALRERGLDRGRIGVELGFGQRLGMNQDQFYQLVHELPDVQFVDATPLMQAVRMLKSDAEVDRLAHACAISEAGTEAGWRVLMPGMTEREILAVMGSAMYARGAEMGTKPTYLAILAGERWRLSNAVASDYAVKNGDLILVDGGATYRGYTCDYIRQAAVGHPTQQQQDWFEAVVEANDDAIAAVRPGVVCHDVYDAALTSLEKKGIAKFNRANIIGHGIGMDVHEVPWIGAPGVYTSDTRIRSGMVVCIEPGVTAPSPKAGPPGHFIVEDIVAVTDEGTRLLTKSLPKSLWITG